MMSFISLSINLSSETAQRPLGLQDACFAHGWVFKRLSAADPELARALHDNQRSKPISIAVVNTKPDTATLRISFMGSIGLRALNAFTANLHQAKSVQFGAATWNIANVICSGEEWAATNTWEDLVRPEVGHNVEFRFVTPTAFTKWDGRSRRFISLLPDPADVFGSLIGKWESLDGPELPAELGDYIRAGGVVISDMDIRCATVRMVERVQKGFVGRVSYACNERSRVHAVAIHQLSRLAFFSGVGYQTARGMGAVLTRSIGGAHA